MTHQRSLAAGAPRHGVNALTVAAGGTLGVAARLALGLTIPDTSGLPVAVFVANIVGAFLLGALTTCLGHGKRRLFWGTGLLGGFTTYSAFTVGTITLWKNNPPLAFAYATASLLLGLVAAFLGLTLAELRRKAAR